MNTDVAVVELVERIYKNYLQKSWRIKKCATLTSHALPKREKKRSLTALLVWQFLFDNLIGRVVLGGAGVIVRVGVRVVVDTIRADLEVDIELLLEHIIIEAIGLVNDGLLTRAAVRGTLILLPSLNDVLEPLALFLAEIGRGVFQIIGERGFG